MRMRRKEAELTLPEDHWRGIPDTYDVLYTSPLGRIPPQVATEDRPLVEEAMRRHNNPNGPDGLEMYSGTLIHLGRTATEARLFLRAFLDERKPGALVPVRYRGPRLSRAGAREVARRRF